MDLAGPSDDVVPWSSSSEPLLYSAVAPARCTIRTKTATATVSPARAYRQREAACLVDARPPKSWASSSLASGTQNPAAGHYFRCFRIHSSFARLYPSLPRRPVFIELELECVDLCTNLCVGCCVRALDGEIFFASGGAARRGAREGLLSMSARSAAHLFENFTHMCMIHDTMTQPTGINTCVANVRASGRVVHLGCWGGRGSRSGPFWGRNSPGFP